MSLRTSLFGTPTRRLVALLVANGVFFGAGFWIQDYIDHRATLPGLTFVLVALWMAAGVLAALVTVISLGEVLVHRGFHEAFLKDDMAELDARLDAGGAVVDLPDDDEALMVPVADGGIRFWLLFAVLTIAYLVGSNMLGGGFLARYTHPGVAVVHMRSADPAMRRQGLNMLADRLDFEATPDVERVVLAALEDPDEGVAARAAFVAGTLGMDAAAPQLATMARTKPALAFAAMIAIAQLGSDPEKAPRAREAARALAADEAPRSEPYALTLMMGMLRVPDIAWYRQIAKHADPKNRVAALWALGRLADPQVLDLLTAALTDSELSVRCAAVGALERLVVFEAAPALRAAFEASEDPLLMCPEISLPVQEDGIPVVLVPYRNYELGLIRALATTDDPALIQWLVKHQEGREYRTNKLMRKLYESLRKKEQSGQLNTLKSRVRLRRLNGRSEDAGPDAAKAADAGTGTVADAGPDATR